MRDKIRKRVRAKSIRRQGFGKHISNKELVDLHRMMAEQTRKERKQRKKRMD